MMTNDPYSCMIVTRHSDETGIDLWVEWWPVGHMGCARRATVHVDRADGAHRICRTERNISIPASVICRIQARVIGLVCTSAWGAST